MQSIHLKIKEQNIAEEGIGQIANHSALNFSKTYFNLTREEYFYFRKF